MSTSGSATRSSYEPCARGMPNSAANARGGVGAARADGGDVEAGGAQVTGEGVGDSARGEDAPAQAGRASVRSCSEVSGAPRAPRTRAVSAARADRLELGDPRLRERGVEVGEDVGEVLQPDRQADRGRADARLGQLRRRQVAVRHRCRVRDEAARVADVGDEAHDLETRDELLDAREVLVGVAGRVQVEREDRAGAARQVGRAPPRARGSTRGRGGGRGRRRDAARGTGRPPSALSLWRATRRSRVSRPCSSWKALNADSDGPRSCTYLVLTSVMYGDPVSPKRSTRLPPGTRR